MTQHSSSYPIQARIGRHEGQWSRNCSECHIGSGYCDMKAEAETAWGELVKINPTSNRAKQQAFAMNAPALKNIEIQ